MKKNPTRFTWDSESGLLQVTNKDYSSQVSTSDFNKAILTVGDYNGDGISGVVVTPASADVGWNGWKLRFGNINGNGFNYGATGNIYNNGTWQSGDINVSTNNIDIQQVVSGDFNGDGYDDMVVLGKCNNKYSSFLYLNSANNSSSILNFSKVLLSDTRKYSIRTVETMGDGIADLFVWFDKSKECRLYYSSDAAGPVNPLSYTYKYTHTVEWDKVDFIDFNGDGLTDIVNRSTSGSSILPCFQQFLFIAKII